MNKNSNTYIILYASVLVVVVATVLAFASLGLSHIQDQNVRIEKMGDILRSIGEAKDLDRQRDKAAYITEQFDRFIIDSYGVNVKGERVEGADAFDLLLNLKGVYEKPAEERVLPVFVSRNAEGVTGYILPVYGSGLWGPIWGYVTLADDWDTILGAVFDHKSETPGLGAEISTAAFQAQFTGKRILNDRGEIVSIALKKGGADKYDLYAVDALSGGTLTSHGVEEMLRRCLSDYGAYIRNARAAAGIGAESGETGTTGDAGTSENETSNDNQQSNE